MQRRDLPGRPAANGWQVLDATQQQRSCEFDDKGEKVCLYMLGPAPKGEIKAQSVNTAGSETKYKAVEGGLSYDSMFVLGEVDGAWRSWKPRMEDWSRCPASCKPEERGDGHCDTTCNIRECDWDMGDCCQEQCEGAERGNNTDNNIELHRHFKCGSGGYTCRGLAAGWTLKLAPNTVYIGSKILTQKAVRGSTVSEDITLTYKP